LAYLRERNHLEDLGFDRRIILKWNLNKLGTWTGLTWFRIGTSGEMFRKR
jgi:hypothetical protein